MRTSSVLVTGIAILFCPAFYQPIQGAIWYVDGTVAESGDGMAWESAFKTIQEGIDAASEGDTVVVGPGTYRERTNFSGKQIELTSRDGPDTTILSTEYNGPVVTFDQRESDKAVMSGFTIRDGTSWGGDGGGIVCIGSSPTIIDCIIRQNTASGRSPRGRGGGVYCSQGSPTFSRCLIADNWADREGGGIYAENASSLTLRNCVITTNRSSSYVGGGICCQDSPLTLSDCEIVENTGGVWCSGEVLATDCIIARNTSSGISCAGSPSKMARCLFSGNSVFLEYNGAADFTFCEGEMSECVFVHNSCDSDTSIARCNYGSLSLVNCVFYSNRASDEGVVRLIESGGKITNCTLLGNSSDGGAAAIEVVASSAEITNSILWGNRDLDLRADAASSDVSIIHCDVGSADAPLATYDGVISSDPLLKDPDNGNFHLLPDSPCRNAGENSLAPDTDIDGEERPVAGVADIGADELKDSDSDSLPDYWEVRFDLDPLDDGSINPDNGANGDPDGDGVCNAEEYCLGTSPCVAPRTLYVSGTNGNDSWDGSSATYQGDNAGPKRTLAAAIESAGGDCLTVRIEGGTYRERIRLGSFLTLEGGWSPGFLLRDADAYPTDLDGERGGTVITFESCRDVTLDGLAITNGLARQGGGILCISSSLTLRKCTITKNEATWSGGGIYADSGSSVRVEECEITDNVSDLRGGGAAFLNGSSAIITNSTISSNTATYDVAEGAALYVADGSSTMSDSLVFDNWASFGRGTIWCERSTVSVTGCVFSGNSAPFSGAAIECRQCEGEITGCAIKDNGGRAVDLDESAVTMAKCTISHNGSGMCLAGDGPIVTECLFCNNGGDAIYCVWGEAVISGCTMVENGRGIFCEVGGDAIIHNSLIARNTEGGITCSHSSPMVINCVITGNRDGYYGGAGICCRDSSFPKLVNCTVWGNNSDKTGGGVRCIVSGVTAVNCIFWENSPDDLDLGEEEGSTVLKHSVLGLVTGHYANGGGNIWDDPRLLNPRRGDLHLRPDSPCIDTGGEAEAPQNDFYGDARPFGGGVDIGADEFVDSDGDSLPDYWETEFGLDPNDDGTANADNGATGDPDDDFVPNIEELLRGTGPMAAPTRLYVSADSGNDEWDGRSPVYRGGSAGPKATLGAAVSLLGGDLSTVYVSEGNYESNISLCSWTTISGGWSPGFGVRDPGCFETIIRGTGQGSVLTCSAVGDVTLDGLTITGGSAREGGGLRGIDCSLTITDCRVQANHADVRGGGLCITGTSEVSISRCRIQANESAHAGGMFLRGTSGFVRDCRFEENAAQDGDGGGLFLDRFLGEVMNCELFDNGARWRGGGMSCSECSPKISDCTFRENCADQGGAVCTVDSRATLSSCRMLDNSAHGGGGLYCLGVSPTLINCEVSGNTAEYGGGIFGYVCNPRLESCRIFGNRANSGGGIRLDYDHWLGVPWLVNCRIFHNSAWEAGALYTYDCDLAMVNCTVVGNADGPAVVYQAQYAQYHKPSILNTIVWGNAPGQHAIRNAIPQLTISHSLISSVDGGYQDIGGNTAGDPLFVNAGKRDFHLLPGSPCIDAGLNDASIVPSTDMDGEYRPFGTSADIGADEYVDQDSDDLPDYWEIESFSHLWFNDLDDIDHDDLPNGDELRWLTDPNNPDTDSDGQSDGREVAAGTDPTDSQSLLQVLRVVLTMDVLQIEFSSVPGRTYQLLVSQDLLDWNHLGAPFAAAESISSFADVAPSFNLRFYRVQVLPEN